VALETAGQPAGFAINGLKGSAMIAGFPTGNWQNIRPPTSSAITAPH